MQAAHPTLNLAPPLIVVEGCGCTQNVEAGMKGKHETRTLALTLIATMNVKYPRKDDELNRGHAPSFFVQLMVVIILVTSCIWTRTCHAKQWPTDK